MRKMTLILAVAALAVLGASCKKLKSRDQLNKGVEAFKNAQYPEAVEHFKTAVELDPDFPTARLYLATAYMQQYIPGADRRRISRWPGRRTTSSTRFWNRPQEHRGHRFHRFAVPEPEEVGRSAAVVREAGRRRPQQRGRLLQPGLYRLVEVVSAPTVRPARSWA